MLGICNNCFQSYEKDFGVCPTCGYVEGMPSDTPQALTPGTVIGSYTVGAVIEASEFSITYKCKSANGIEILRECFPKAAMKRDSDGVQLIQTSPLGAHQISAFRQLNKKLTTLSLDGIVRRLDCFDANGTVYAVEEYSEGLKLSEYLAQSGGKLDRETAMDLAVSISNALTTLNSAGIICTGLSLDSLFIRLEKGIVLTDADALFYVSEPFSLRPSPIDGFAAPELYSGAMPGAYTDTYSFAAVLRQLLTGQPMPVASRRTNDTAFLSGANSAVYEKALQLSCDNRTKTPAEFLSAMLAEKPAPPVMSTPTQAAAVTLKAPKSPPKASLAKTKLSPLLLLLLIPLIIVIIILVGGGKELKPADLTLWYTQTGNEALDKRRSTAINALTDAFLKNNPNGITITTESYGSAELSQRINSGAPSICQIDAPDIANSDSFINISGIISDASSDSYKLLDAGNKKCVASSISVPTFCVNGDLVELEASDLAAAITAYDLHFADDDIEFVLATLPIIVSQSNSDNLNKVGFTTNMLDSAAIDSQALLLFSQDFCGGYLGESGEGRYLFTALSGMKLFPSDSSLAKSSNFWALGSSGSKEQEKAAEAFLEFVLSEEGQKILYFSNDFAGLPINKNIAEQFVSSNSDFACAYEGLK